MYTFPILALFQLEQKDAVRQFYSIQHLPLHLIMSFLTFRSYDSNEAI
jgi:hypothetical protein